MQDHVCAFCLPEKQISLLKKKLQLWPAGILSESKVPLSMKLLIKKIQKHLSGELQDFSSVPICLSRSTDFQIKIYNQVQSIPAGKVYSYKELGSLLGGLKAFRAIGTAMGKNPIPLIVPCHRIVGSGNHLGGFSAPGGIKTKIKLLSIEGVDFRTK